MSKPAEDIVMKCIMELFIGDALEFFGLKKRIVSGVTVDAAARTEMLHVHVQKNINDWVLEAEDGSYVHMEFASSYKKKDLRRYMVTDAVMHFKTGKPITTVVVYTANVKNKPVKLNAGSINYKVNAFYMSDLDGDTAYAKISAKIAKGESLAKQDLMSMVFLPMMKSSIDKEERFEQAVAASTKIKDYDEQQQVQAMIVLLAEKFLTHDSWMKIKERIAMGEFFKMIRDECMQEGMEEGLKKGMEQGLEKGMEKGLEKGMEKGIEQGITQGIEQGTERRNIDIATEMLRDGMDVKTVVKYSKLPKAKVLVIKAEIDAA